MSRTPYTYLDGDMRHLTKSSSTKTFITLCILFITFILAVSFLHENDRDDGDDAIDDNITATPLIIDPKGSPIFEAFYNCVRPKLAPLIGNYDEFWFSFVNLTKDCDELEEYKAIDLRKAANRDEIKYVAYPKKDEDLTMVTFGIGHDVSAEKVLKEMYPKFSFYGVDPSSYINKDLYETELKGKYFEYAISGSSGMQNSKVFGKGGYREEVTKTIGADDFFADKVQMSALICSLDDFF